AAMRIRLFASALALAAAVPATASGTPVLARASVPDLPWIAGPVAPIAWNQLDVPASGGPVVVQVNEVPAEAKAAPDWVTRLVVTSPLLNGTMWAWLPVDGLDGTHEVRVGLAGAAGSPLSIGTVRLDRTAPLVRDAVVEPAAGEAGVVAVRWTQADDHSGSVVAVVEVNEGVGPDLRSWVPFRTQPQPPWDG